MIDALIAGKLYGSPTEKSSKAGKACVTAKTPKADRVRVDYMPCQAALHALQAAQAMFPEANTQALIDRMVITGLSALVHGKWQPPYLYGQRDGWKLPNNLREQVPGESTQSAAK